MMYVNNQELRQYLKADAVKYHAGTVSMAFYTK